MTHIALFGDLVHGPTQANRRRPGPDIGHEPTTEGGLAVTLSVTEQSGSSLLTVSVQGPARFASLHTVDKASLGAGVPHCLVPPAIHESEPGTPELHAYPGLWIYDRTAFARAGSSFAVSRSWTHDGEAVAGETATIYHRRAGDELVSIGLVEAVLCLDGGSIAAEAAPLPAAPPEPEPDLPTLQVSDADSAFIVEGLDAEATHVALSITAPSPYAGSYQVALADIVAGQPVCLVPPEVTEGADRTLSARAALWVYDPAVMPTFSVDYAWIDADGVAIPYADAPEWTRTTYRAVRFRETATGRVADVTTLSGTVPAITVPATVVSAARPIIPTAGLLADHRAMSFAANITFATAPTTDIDCIMGSSANANALGIFRVASPATTVRARHASVEGSTPSKTSPDNMQDAARPRLTLVSSIDLDASGATNAAIVNYFATNGVVSATESFSNTARPGTDRLTPIDSLLGRPNGARPVIGTVHAFLWLHPAFIEPVVLRDALFDTVPLDVDPTGYLPKLLPENGTVTIGGSPITPLVFLSGTNLDQFNDGGTWKVPNKGSAGGLFTLPLGAFA